MARGIPAFIANIKSDEWTSRVLRQISVAQKSEHSFSEQKLQLLIHHRPELLPVRDFYPSVTDLYSLGTEIPVDLGSSQGSIDNLFVTNDAHLVLVETKLYRNPEGIRTVVAQTFQYGVAVGEMSLMQLEECIRKGSKLSNPLKSGQTIVGRVQEQATVGGLSNVVDDFEDRLETHLRAGEILYLIVADGIRTSVERMTHWLNEIGGSAPHKFGLVELRIYESGDGVGIVIPRTLLRTKEISRHVVEVRLKDGSGEKVSAEVIAQSKTEGGGTSITSRSVKSAGPPMTKDRLLSEVKAKSNKAYAVVFELLQELELLGLDSRSTPATLQYGLLIEEDFYSLVGMSTLSLYSRLPIKLIAKLGDSAFVQHKQALNRIGAFFRLGEVDDPKKIMNELTPRYERLAGKIPEFVKVIKNTRDKAMAALSEENAKFESSAGS